MGIRQNSATEPAEDHRENGASATLPFFERLDAGENHRISPAFRLHRGFEHFGEPGFPVLETRLEPVFEKVVHDPRDVEVGLEVLASVAGQKPRGDRPEAFQQAQPLTGAALADSKLLDDLIHGQRVRSDKEETVNLADRLRESENLDKRHEKLDGHAAEPGFGFCRGGAHGRTSGQAAALGRGAALSTRHATRDGKKGVWEAGSTGKNPGKWGAIPTIFRPLFK